MYQLFIKSNLLLSHMTIQKSKGIMIMKKTMILGLSLLGLGVFTGCTTQTDKTTDNSDTTKTTEVAKDKEVDVMSVKDAVAKYNETYPDTKVISVKLDKSAKTYTYKVKGVGEDAEYSVKIDGVTREIVKEDTEKLDKDDEHKAKAEALDLSKAISINEATKIAEKEVGKGSAHEWKLKKESQTGAMVWKVEVKDGRKEIDVKINAETGDILGTEKED